VIGYERGGDLFGGMPYPIVRFINGREVTVTPEIWNVEMSGERIASRIQIPLLLSWALSIHKSQGQTIERVKVDLGKVFERGQAYVAISRTTSFEGLQILNFSSKKVMAHPNVIGFYEKLENV